MKIELNGLPRQLPEHTTLAGLLQEEGLAERRVAVEINGDIIPRSQHVQRILLADDRVEIVHALGGG